MDYSKFLTERIQTRKPSPIRELAPLINAPGMISLGGGMPNPKTFPFKEIDVTLQDGTKLKMPLDEALQYSSTPGLSPLISILSRMQEREHSAPGLPHVERAISVTTGSQDAIAKAFTMLLDEHSTLLMENPTYCGSIDLARSIGCRIESLESDEYGMDPAYLRKLLASWNSPESFPSVLYVIPTGANPSGVSLSLERKQNIYRIAQEFNLLILEDDPYYYLRLEENAERTKSFLSLDCDGRVLRFDSFSKILSSGLRIGFVTGPKPLIRKIDLQNQVTCIHTSGLSQIVVAQLLDTWGEEGWNEHLSSICEFYRRQRDSFLKYADKYLKGLAEWNVPKAGMFVWMKILGTNDTRKLILEKAIEQNVLLLPGVFFRPDGFPSSYVRAAFSTATDTEMDEALGRFSKLLRDHV